MANYARGKMALGDCDICGFTYQLGTLRFLTIRMKKTNILACPECWSKDHPQLRQGVVKISDPQALKDARPASNADRTLTPAVTPTTGDFLYK